MAQNIVGRKADGEQVRRWTTTNVLILHQFLGKLEFVLVGECGRANDLIKAGVGAVFGLAMRGRAQHGSL